MTCVRVLWVPVTKMRMVARWSRPAESISDRFGRSSYF